MSAALMDANVEGELSERQMAGAKLFDDFLAGLGNFAFKAQIILDCKNYILKQLSLGKLIAYGFAKGSKTISAVPNHLFKYPEYVDWTNSKVIGHGLDYISVDLYRASVSVRKLDAPEIKRPGRKPFNQLLEIIAELNSSDASFVSRTRKHQADVVRRLAEAKYAERFAGGGFPNEKTIKRYLKEYFDGIKATKSHA